MMNSISSSGLCKLLKIIWIWVFFPSTTQLVNVQWMCVELSYSGTGTSEELERMYGADNFLVTYLNVSAKSFEAWMVRS